MSVARWRSMSRGRRSTVAGVLHAELRRRVNAVYGGRKLTPEVAGHLQEDLERWFKELVPLRATVQVERAEGGLKAVVRVRTFFRKSLAFR